MKFEAKKLLRALNFKKIEWIFLFCGISIATIATLGLLFQQSEKKQNPAGLKQIGTLETVGSDVKRKFFSEIDFEPTSQKDNVFLKDTLFVGPGSKVKLALGEYGDFELIPNSVLLVYLDFEPITGVPSTELNSSVGQSLKLKLSQGEVRYTKPVLKAGVDAPHRSVAIEISENTYLKLDGQNELKMERTKSGEITVHEATVEPLVEKIPDLAFALSVPADDKESTLMAATPQHFELKIGESFTQKDLNLHANLLQANRSPATLEVAEQPEAQTLIINDNQEDKANALSSTPIEEQKEMSLSTNAEPVETLVPETTSEKVRPQEPKLRYGILSIAPDFASTKIQSIEVSDQTRATLLSKSNFGLETTYSQVWASNLQTDFIFGFKKMSIIEPSLGGTLKNADQSYYSYGAAARYQFSDEFLVLLGAGMSQRPFLRAISENSVSTDATTVPSFWVGAGYDIIQTQPFKFGAALNLGLDLPTTGSSYKSKTNPFYVLNVYAKQSIHSKIESEVGLKSLYQTQNTNIVDQSQTDYGIYFKLSFKFGNNTK